MTLFSYEIFDAVARQGSFNKAAQQLHLTPSAISHAIAVMEEELGFALFNRGKNGVSMTSYGASLYPSIRDVLNSDEALKQSIARLNGLEKGKVFFVVPLLDLELFFELVYFLHGYLIVCCYHCVIVALGREKGRCLFVYAVLQLL